MGTVDSLILGAAALFFLVKIKKEGGFGLGGGGDTDKAEAAPAPAKEAPAKPAAPAAGGTGATKTGKSIYPVVGPISATGDTRLSGKASSARDNQGFPCAKCNRETTWIFVPGSGGDFSAKLGSHGSGGDNGSLIEWEQTIGSGGKKRWRCEGPHKTYKQVGTSGDCPVSGSKPVGIKGISWTLGGNKSHHEIWYDATGSGNSWKKCAVWEGVSGCNPMTCPVPSGKAGAHCQDTMRVDGGSGYKFVSGSMVEIRPPRCSCSS